MLVPVGKNGRIVVPASSYVLRQNFLSLGHHSESGQHAKHEDP